MPCFGLVIIFSFFYIGGKEKNMAENDKNKNGEVQQSRIQEDDKVKRARERVRRIKNFYSSVITYVIVSIILLIINLITNRHHLWFYWIILIWGAILLIQAINLFTIRDRFLGESWEEKKMKDLLDKEDKRNKNNKT